MRIVVLDGFTENPGDLSWGPFEKFGEVVVYDRTSYVESPLIAERLKGADIAVINKTPISKETIICQGKRNCRHERSDIRDADRGAVRGRPAP